MQILPPGTRLTTYSKLLERHLEATILEHHTDFWSGTERFEGYRIQFANGEEMVIATDRVGKDFQVVREPEPVRLSDPAYCEWAEYLPGLEFDLETGFEMVPLSEYDRAELEARIHAEPVGSAGWLLAEAA